MRDDLLNKDEAVFFRIFIAKLSEDTETVTLEEELRLGEKIDATVEHEGDGHGHYGAQLRGVAGVYAEGHQGASSQHGTEVGSVAGSTQNIVMQIPGAIGCWVFSCSWIPWRIVSRKFTVR